MVNISGGLLVAITTKYAGSIANIMSGIASIAITHLFETITSTENTFEWEGQSVFAVGLVIVAVCTYLYYTMGQQAKRVTLPVEEAPLEGEAEKGLL
ncbi:hypothetical protein CBS101457_004989 [Exobasidium rhododendri]|nr:hypothetical protein CBS101457_004989 [Exobasidium rhododendri]